MVSEDVKFLLKHPEIQKLFDDRNSRIRELEDIIEDGIYISLFRIFGDEKMNRLLNNADEDNFVPLPGTDELLTWAIYADRYINGEVTRIPFLRMKSEGDLKEDALI